MVFQPILFTRAMTDLLTPSMLSAQQTNESVRLVFGFRRTDSCSGDPQVRIST